MRHWPLLLPLLTIAATAQTNTSARRAAGTVTGHVYCADTNTPARMASVQLERLEDVEDRGADRPYHYSGPPSGGVVQTAFDGSFTFSSVPPGSYYVVVSAPGYLSPRANGDEFDNAAPQPPAGQQPIVIPKVNVQADQTANIDVRLERGAAISGTVRFDDGGPASGVHVMVLHRRKDKWVLSNFTSVIIGGNMDTTDDLGRYRVSGLRDRDYLVMLQLSRTDLESRGARDAGLSGVERSMLRIYSGDTPHIGDAVPVKLGAGEEHSGADITIPLSKFHSISGVVTAAGDGHPINSGHLSIEDPRDKEAVVDAELGSDGTFHLEGVPEGTYTLYVRSPRDQQFREVSVGNQQTITNEKTLHQYSDLEQTLKVEGDIPSLVLTVTEKSRQRAARSQ
jgi:hypothetical protein